MHCPFEIIVITPLKRSHIIPGENAVSYGNNTTKKREGMLDLFLIDIVGVMTD